MIDTIVLALDETMYQIIDPDKFQPSAQLIKSKSKFITCKQNPTKKELIKGIYKPNLTLSNRISLSGFSEVILKIELSLPKLIFGNNFNELRLKDFQQITIKLVGILKDMGVCTTAATLSKAPIFAVHYSKNIPLTDGSTPYHYINKIKECNVKLSLDVNQTDYRNEGHSYKWHCNSYEVVFYDKIKDLEKAKQSEKRSIEKDSAIQLNIFEKLKRRHKLEFLRMEVRLNKRAKIKQLFSKLNIKPSKLTFKSVFKPSISKKVLLHYLDELESKRSNLLDYKPANDKSLLTTLILNNPDLKPKQVLQVFGLKKALESVNIRELRQLFKSCNAKTWQRLIQDAEKVKLPIKQPSFDVIRECIEKFKPVKFNKF